MFIYVYEAPLQPDDEESRREYIAGDEDDDADCSEQQCELS